MFKWRLRRRIPFYCLENIEDTKGVFRSRKSKKEKNTERKRTRNDVHYTKKYDPHNYLDIVKITLDTRFAKHQCPHSYTIRYNSHISVTEEYNFGKSSIMLTDLLEIQCEGIKTNEYINRK